MTIIEAILSNLFMHLHIILVSALMSGEMLHCGVKQTSWNSFADTIALEITLKVKKVATDGA